MPPFAAARMEQKIVKIPKHELIVTLDPAEAAIATGLDLENNLAVNEQGEELNFGKNILSTQLRDLMRRRKNGQSGRDVRIAYPKQRAGTRRFEDHLSIASPHVSEPRQNESARLGERRHSRPIVGELGFDDDEVLAALRACKPVFQ